MKNNFPLWVVKEIFKEEKEKLDNRKNADKKRHFKADVKFESEEKKSFVSVTLPRRKSLYLTKSMK